MADEKPPEPVREVVHHHVHTHHHRHPPRERPYPVKDPASRYDALGRKQPKQLGFIEAARRLPWLARTFEKVVPQTYVAIDDGVATVSCPCGGRPEIGLNRIDVCPGDCGRWFVFDGRRVHVARAEAVRS